MFKLHYTAHSAATLAFTKWKSYDILIRCRHMSLMFFQLREFSTGSAAIHSSIAFFPGNLCCKMNGARCLIIAAFSTADHGRFATEMKKY